MQMTPEGYYAHESSFIEQPSTIGRGTKIWRFCHVMAGAVVGENCILGQNVMVAGGAVVGDGVKIQNNVSVYAGVTVEDGAFLGPSCVFTNVKAPRAFLEKKQEFHKTQVGTGASIGANATIVCGCRIGKFALVGAGCVVTRDVPDYGLVVGNPGRLIGYACRCGETLRWEDGVFSCPSCAARYPDLRWDDREEDLL